MTEEPGARAWRAEDRTPSAAGRDTQDERALCSLAFNTRGAPAFLFFCCFCRWPCRRRAMASSQGREKGGGVEFSCGGHGGGPMGGPATTPQHALRMHEQQQRERPTN